jgi:hypothetical protein
MSDLIETSNHVHQQEVCSTERLWKKKPISEKRRQYKKNDK